VNVATAMKKAPRVGALFMRDLAAFIKNEPMQVRQYSMQSLNRC
jgi:hypothetical protein